MEDKIEWSGDTLDYVVEDGISIREDDDDSDGSPEGVASMEVRKNKTSSPVEITGIIHQ